MNFIHRSEQHRTGMVKVKREREPRLPNNIKMLKTKIHTHTLNYSMVREKTFTLQKETFTIQQFVSSLFFSAISSSTSLFARAAQQSLLLLLSREQTLPALPAIFLYAIRVATFYTSTTSAVLMCNMRIYMYFWPFCCLCLYICICHI